MSAAAAAVVLAALLDCAVGEPPNRFHPVARFGGVVALFDREWRRPGPVGVALAVVLPLLAGAAVAVPVWLAAAAAPLAGAAAAGLVLFASTSRRMLVEVAGEVVAATEGEDIGPARERLPALVGRDPGSLSAGEVRSAAVESAAENLADGLVAPLAAFALLGGVSLPLAAAGAAWVKAVNTLDSMLGYRSKPVGRASARLDDAVMWLPARASAALVAASADARVGAPRTLARARAWADAPPSPNSGWPMAALAAALDVRLTKPGAYTLNEAAPLPSVADGRRGVRAVGTAGLLAYVLAVVAVWF